MNVKQLFGAMSATIVKIAITAVIVVVVFRLAVSAYDFGFQIFADIPIAEEGNGRTVNVVISEGQDSKEIGKLLEQKGLIENGTIFYIQEILSEYKGMIQPGTYELNTAMSATQMIEIMCKIDEATEETE